MKCLCGGHFPSIEAQARRLHDEPGMPEWSLATYERWVEAINEYLLWVLIEHYKVPK